MRLLNWRMWPTLASSAYARERSSRQIYNILQWWWQREKDRIESALEENASNCLAQLGAAAKFGVPRSGIEDWFAQNRQESLQDLGVKRASGCAPTE